jgi:hypothetical protein
MFGRWGALFLGTLAAAVLVSSAGARTQVLFPAIDSSAINLATNAGVATFLTSHGIDSKGIVIQRGSHNYAGPSCPGITWACTTAKRVVQFSTRDSNNQFQCTPSTGGSSTAPGDCTIVQFSSGGNNEARCVEQTSDSVGASQHCVIFQTNSTGDNKLEIEQQVDANGGASQDAKQYAGVNQTNGSGSNDAQIQQDLEQSTKDTAGGSQTQNGHQTVSVTQLTDTGDNTARVHQSLAQDATATSSTVVQSQNTDSSSGLNTSAAIKQTSTSGGQNDAHLNQSNQLNGTVSKSSNGTQTQGWSGGGLFGHFDQSSSGLSLVNGSQQERQILKITGGRDSREYALNIRADDRGHHDKTPPGIVTQTQYGPAWWGSSQSGNSSDTYNIDSNSAQRASNPGSFQSDKEYANCETSGICNAEQHINQNGNNQRNSCSSPSCHIGLIVIANGEGAGTTRCSSEGCPSPPPPPPPCSYSYNCPPTD